MPWYISTEENNYLCGGVKYEEDVPSQRPLSYAPAEVIIFLSGASLVFGNSIRETSRAVPDHFLFLFSRRERDFLSYRTTLVSPLNR